ncbi:hypothetical protein MIND_01196200 [Mycena indigotica]|uniref:Uncharacterized protein n=1 Tax=Mycena indigotica TaxID=2126181 RepID=A0A8H6S4F5_9AGAR|nr:uncharacterized protein MIND_01196200 [Mycena indigotica]KAF7292970.1 hypothetical protein MIND_01196200 [Mycena indigotica]
MSNPSGPCFGSVRTTLDALTLIHAARGGRVPYISQQLNKVQCKAFVKSGAIFIFSPEESNIKRWMDGLTWSTSRAIGNFLFYHELDRDPSRDIPPKASKDFKPNGLIKKAITMHVAETEYRVISYYTVSDLVKGELDTPCSSSMAVTPMDVQTLHNDKLPFSLRFEQDIQSLSLNAWLFRIDMTVDPWATSSDGRSAARKPQTKATTDDASVVRSKRGKRSSDGRWFHVEYFKKS